MILGVSSNPGDSVILCPNTALVAQPCPCVPDLSLCPGPVRNSFLFPDCPSVFWSPSLLDVLSPEAAAIFRQGSGWMHAAFISRQQDGGTPRKVTPGQRWDKDMIELTAPLTPETQQPPCMAARRRRDHGKQGDCGCADTARAVTALSWPAATDRGSSPWLALQWFFLRSSKQPPTGTMLPVPGLGSNSRWRCVC